MQAGCIQRNRDAVRTICAGFHLPAAFQLAQWASKRSRQKNSTPSCWPIQVRQAAAIALPTAAKLMALRSPSLRHAAHHVPCLLQQARCYAGASQLQLIKELRERTGAPMTDVKNALTATNWDLGAHGTGRSRAGRAAAARHAPPGSCHSASWAAGLGLKAHRHQPCPTRPPARLQRRRPRSSGRRGWQRLLRRQRGTQQRGWWGSPRAHARRRWWRCGRVVVGVCVCVGVGRAGGSLPGGRYQQKDNGPAGA